MSEHPNVGRAALGAVLAVAGSLLLTGLFLVSNSSDPAMEQLMFRIGLALAGLLSALGQGLVFFGIWLLWSAARGR
ncbi:hypothetical protein [Phenylobacterium sp.]|uniref:hypothetical protein n=1 Tax=Phenylobacterium sp. TaxID=1871053 RepID=UPI002FE23A23